MYQEYYIAPGSVANWRYALTDENVWGLPKKREPAWGHLKTGDMFFFYVQSPFSAVAGYGEIERKFRDSTPLFPDELAGINRWPLRFKFQILLASTDLSVTPSVSIADILKYPRLKRFNELWPREAEELLRRCKDHIKSG